MAALRESHGDLEDAKEKPERTGYAMNAVVNMGYQLDVSWDLLWI